MAPRNRFESEYKANFTPHETERASLQRRLTSNQHDVEGQGLHTKGDDKPVDDVKRKTQKAKENRALKYKAGLAPTMSVRNKLRYLSEYQKQFEWKKPLEREAPILSAEKMIYGGQDGNPSKASKVNLPKKTEYQLQFVRHPFVSGSPDSEQKVDKEKAIEEKQRLEYTPVGYQDSHVAAGKPSKKSPPPILPKKSVVFQSEYHANFKSPSKYEYIKGSWVGADPPHLHPPDEKSDSESKPSNTAWYQQVLELRERVRSYQSRAREGSHFIGILRDRRQHRESAETSNKNPSKNTNEETAEPSHDEQVHPDTPRSKPSRKSTPVKTNEKRDDRLTRDVTKSEDSKKAESQPNYYKTVVLSKGPCESKTVLQPVASGDEKLLWDKNLAVPGPPLKKVHSLETLSHESTISDGSTISNASGEGIHGEQAHIRREAWSEERPNRTLLVPPYHISSSSASIAGSDSRSDVTISEMEQSNDDQPLHHGQETKRLFTGRRQETAEDRGGPSHHGQETRRLFTGRRQETAEDRGRQSGIHSHGDDKPSHHGQAIPSATRKLFSGRRQETAENHGGQYSHSHGNSSDDERSVCSFNSQSSDALSVEAMDKRRTLASETLQRAKRRQAQL